MQVKQGEFDEGSILVGERGETEGITICSEVCADWEWNTTVVPYSILNTSELYIHMQVSTRVPSRSLMKLIMSKIWGSFIQAAWFNQLGRTIYL